MKKLCLTHKAVIPDINYSQLDSGCVDIVKYFNSQGLLTEMSCQGHGKVNQSLFWVSFNRDVTEDDVLRFQSCHLDDRGNFCSCGHFCQRVCMTYSPDTDKQRAYHCWEYVAANVEAAMADLSQWKRSDVKRIS